MSAARHDVVSIVPKGQIGFGLHLPIAAQSLSFSQGWEGECGPAEMRRIAENADRLGYFYLAVSDHVAVPRELTERMSTIWYDTVATLAWCAAATKQIRLMSYVAILPYRHPLDSAKAYSTVDALSGGRLILGVGTGHAKAEFDALGVDFKRRGKLLDESIDAIAEAFREEYPSHEGPAFKFSDVGMKPRPVQRPRPPIWVGGSSKAAIRRAAERGDGWLPQGPPEMGMAGAIEMLRGHRAETRGDAPIEIGQNSPWMYVGKPTWDLPEGSISGSGEELAEPLRAAKALGVNHMGVRLRARSVHEQVDQLELFMREVAPLVNA
ncbi:MAG: TIGR03619 family F420-dependent LLM class oxidoreductase [Candidatus Binatia bacterium]|nr:TIGR03619 family F420-dependent LLM class oxidoreductase [Candidatus Binatia bacterium]